MRSLVLRPGSTIKERSFPSRSHAVRYEPTYIAQVSSSVSGKLTDFLMRPLSHEFFTPWLCLRLKKYLNSVEMSPVRMPWRQAGRVFWNAGQTCPAAFVRFFFDDVWFSSGRRSRAFLWRSKVINCFQNGIHHLIGDCDLSQLEDNGTGMTHNTGTDLDQL